MEKLEFNLSQSAKVDDPKLLAELANRALDGKGNIGPENVELLNHSWEGNEGKLEIKLSKDGIAFGHCDIPYQLRDLNEVFDRLVVREAYVDRDQSLEDMLVKLLEWIGLKYKIQFNPDHFELVMVDDLEHLKATKENPWFVGEIGIHWLHKLSKQYADQVTVAWEDGFPNSIEPIGEGVLLDPEGTTPSAQGWSALQLKLKGDKFVMKTSAHQTVNSVPVDLEGRNYVSTRLKAVRAREELCGQFVLKLGVPGTPAVHISASKLSIPEFENYVWAHDFTKITTVSIAFDTDTNEYAVYVEGHKVASTILGIGQPAPANTFAICDLTDGPVHGDAEVFNVYRVTHGKC